MRSLGFAFAVLGALATFPASAQQWKSYAGEHKCSVSHNSSNLSVIDEKGTREFRGNIALTDQTQPQPLTASASSSGGAIPGLRVEQYADPGFTNQNGSMPPRLSVTVTGTLTSAAVSMLRGSDTIYLRRGRDYWRMPLLGFAQAIDLLNACRPIIPPPNRRATPNYTFPNWVDQYNAASFPVGAFGGFEADVRIDAEGKFLSCTVAVSSGNAQADAKYCAIIGKRGRFVRATDGNSRFVAASLRVKMPPVRRIE